MGGNLTKHSHEINDACTLAAMRATTGCGYRFDIKEHCIWGLKRVASGACALCNDNKRKGTWREVMACGHRFHRSCLRDHRRDHEPRCPTCESSYSVITREKVLVDTGERADVFSWARAGFVEPSTTITFSEGSTTNTDHDREIAKMISNRIESSSDPQIQKAVRDAFSSVLQNQALFLDARKSGYSQKHFIPQNSKIGGWEEAAISLRSAML